MLHQLIPPLPPPSYHQQPAPEQGFLLYGGGGYCKIEINILISMLFLLFLNWNLSEIKIGSFTPNPLSKGEKPCSNTPTHPPTPSSLTHSLHFFSSSFYMRQNKLATIESQKTQKHDKILFFSGSD